MLEDYTQEYPALHKAYTDSLRENNRLKEELAGVKSANGWLTEVVTQCHQLHRVNIPVLLEALRAGQIDKYNGRQDYKLIQRAIDYLENLSGAKS